MGVSDDDFQQPVFVLRTQQKSRKPPRKRCRIKEVGSAANNLHIQSQVRGDCRKVEIRNGTILNRAVGEETAGATDNPNGEAVCWKAGIRLSKHSLESVEITAATQSVNCRKVDEQVHGDAHMDATEYRYVDAESPESGDLGVFGHGSGLGSEMNALLSLCRNAAPEEHVPKENDCDEDIVGIMTQVQVDPTHVTVLEDITNRVSSSVFCPICNVDIGGLSVKQREDHSNECLDKLVEQPKVDSASLKDQTKADPTSGTGNVAPVVDFLDKLNLSKYASLFIKEEIDWDTLQWITEEDLCNLGIEAFGPRKKIVSAIKEEKRKENERIGVAVQSSPVKKYITDFFGASSTTSKGISIGTSKMPSGKNTSAHKDNPAGKKQRKTVGMSKSSAELPAWKNVPGTKFRVDAFKHLTNDCSYWFLTHFHSDHYQGLTKGFRYGKIYCSMITARLVNLRIGIPWDRLHPLGFNERTEVDRTYVTLLDANHCPGAAMILFETDGKIVLHTGDFRYCEEMAKFIAPLPSRIHTLILDTTYCNPQYDFPKQEAVVQFVIDAIQAESFNPNTLFLIGTYSLGKERLFLEVARVLQKKIYVGAVKRKMLACLDLNKEDLSLITTNDWESSIHVVPLWSIASFKRMASISRHYHGKYSIIVSFSPTGWSFGRGKRRNIGNRWQQGTIIRYEVPYSEHSSFTELKEFVKMVDPVKIIPSVNNTSPHAAQSMVSSLL